MTSGMPIVQGLEWLWDALGQCLCPSRCAACDEPLTDGHATGQLCTACFALCEPCPIDASDLSTQAPRCRSSFVYEGPLSTALLRLKWQGRDDLARPLGLLLGPLLHDLMDQYDWLVPVPLHRERLRRRGYNQSTLLAREALRCQTGRPRLRLHVGLLTATRPTLAAHQLRRSERFQRALSRFAVPARAQPKVANRRIVLVDDVITTGATVAACSEALTQAGAAEVTAISLLRVIR